MKPTKKLLFFTVASIIILLLTLTQGAYPLTLKQIILNIESLPDIIKRTTPITPEQRVFYYVRLPRVLAAFLVGAALASSGSGYQALFRNPLVSPGILGVLGGAGFGASIGILLDQPFYIVQLLAFLFGVIAVMAAYGIAWRGGGARIIDLVLGGIIVSIFFRSLISVVKFMADPEEKLPQIVYWLMGGLAGTSWKDVDWLLAFVIPSIIGLLIIRWKLDAFMVGEEEAKTLGVRIEYYKAIVIILSTLPAAAATAVAGIIGWVGLVVPHAARMIFGYSNRYSLPGSIILGATFLLIVDTISRAYLPTELPLEVLTSFVGVPAFAYLIRKRIYHGWG